MNQPVKIGIAGTGFGRKVALPVYCELDEFSPVACWSRTPEKAEKVASEAGVPLATSDFDEFLSAPGLEAVHVATPVATHLEFASKAAQRGLHVLCEKPLAENLDSARKIAGAIRKAGVVGQAGFGLRMKQTRAGVIKRARETVGRPRMAVVSLVHSDHATAESRPWTWVHDEKMAGGRLQGYGVHDLDLLLQIFPEVESVAAATDTGVPERLGGDGQMHPVSTEDAYSIIMRFKGGGIAVVNLVATARHPRNDLIEIYGDEGSVRLDTDYRLWWGKAGEELKSEGPLSNSSTDGFKEVALNFYAAIREDKPADPSMEEALAVQAVFDAAHLANQQRRWVQPAAV